MTLIERLESASKGSRWRDYLNEPPGNNEDIEMMRVEWDSPLISRPSFLHPLFNVAGLKWRPLSAQQTAKEE